MTECRHPPPRSVAHSFALRSLAEFFNPELTPCSRLAQDKYVLEKLADTARIFREMQVRAKPRSWPVTGRGGPCDVGPAEHEAASLSTIKA